MPIEAIGGLVLLVVVFFFAAAVKIQMDRDDR